VTQKDTLIPRGKKLPEALPRIALLHELPYNERVCPHDGHFLSVIREVTYEKPDIIPAKIQVIRHILKQYAYRCGMNIKTAMLPLQPIPNMASSGLLSHITVSKYQDALPLYRQEATHHSCNKWYSK
jgi:transposase